MDEQLDKAAEKEAWIGYYMATHGLDTLSYEKVEPFAWARLQARLGRLKVRRVRNAA